jgi:threonyl-tRNA synthetase
MRDHHKLGGELELFDTDPLVGAGLPYWLPAGAAIRHAIEDYIREAERRAGYQHVHSPVLGKRELYELSGHWAHFRDDMFPPMELGGEQLVLRPSLCPHHALIFRSRQHSYHELPLRIAELGGMYRAELSGVLGGLTRVRAIQLNDAHVFCAVDQVAEEVAGVLDMIEEAYAALGIRAARHRLSLRGQGADDVADPVMWDREEALLAAVLRARGVSHDAEAGEGAFYGPKIDVQMPAAAALVRRCIEQGLRAELAAPQRGTLGARVRAARRVPYQAVIGPREQAVGAVALRLRDGRHLAPLPAVDVIARIAAAASPTHALSGHPG